MTGVYDILVYTGPVSPLGQTGQTSRQGVYFWDV